MKTLRLLAALAVGMGTCGAASAQTPAEVVKTYADIAHAGYEDSLITARALGCRPSMR